MISNVIPFPTKHTKTARRKAVKPKPKRLIGFSLHIHPVDKPGQERGMLHGFFTGNGYRSFTAGLYTSLFRDGGYFKVYCDKDIAAYLMPMLRERFPYIEVRRLVSFRAA